MRLYFGYVITLDKALPSTHYTSFCPRARYLDDIACLPSRIEPYSTVLLRALLNYDNPNTNDRLQFVKCCTVCCADPIYVVHTWIHSILVDYAKTQSVYLLEHGWNRFH